MLRALVILFLLSRVAAADPKPGFAPHAEVKGLVKQSIVEFELDPWTRGDKPRRIVHMDAGAAKELAALHHGDEVVVAAKSAILVIDYPLHHAVERKVIAAGKGITRAEIVKAVCDAYQQIYAEEEDSSKVKTTPQGQRGTLQNRNTTEGTYGIWGHDLGDLDLVQVKVDKSPANVIYLDLIVDS